MPRAVSQPSIPIQQQTTYFCLIQPDKTHRHFIRWPCSKSLYLFQQFVSHFRLDWVSYIPWTAEDNESLGRHIAELADSSGVPAGDSLPAETAGLGHSRPQRQRHRSSSNDSVSSARLCRRHRHMSLEQDGTLLVDGVRHRLSPVDDFAVTRVSQIRSRYNLRSETTRAEDPCTSSIATRPLVVEETRPTSTTSSVALPSMRDPLDDL